MWRTCPQCLERGVEVKVISPLTDLVGVCLPQQALIRFQRMKSAENIVGLSVMGYYWTIAELS